MLFIEMYFYVNMNSYRKLFEFMLARWLQISSPCTCVRDREFDFAFHDTLDEKANKEESALLIFIFLLCIRILSICITYFSNYKFLQEISSLISLLVVSIIT